MQAYNRLQTVACRVFSFMLIKSSLIRFQISITLIIFLCFIADHTAACSITGYWHDNVVRISVRPSVRLSVCDEVHCGAHGRWKFVDILL